MQKAFNLDWVYYITYLIAAPEYEHEIQGAG